MTTPAYLSRTELLLGSAALERLRNARVLVLGLGGVGAYAAEMLVRAGVGNLTIVDGDLVEESNRNRQLIALVSTLGRPKSEVLAERLRDINPECRITPIRQFIREEKGDELLEPDYDYVVDAIDSLSPKAYFIAKCVARGLPLISSMGSGGRLDPLQLRIADISRTYGCGLARAVRKRLARLGIRNGVETVFSPEPVPPDAIRTGLDADGKRRSTTGTISYLPAVFGCALASVVIRRLAGVTGGGRNAENPPTDPS